jgi:hypothetical protein
LAQPNVPGSPPNWYQRATAPFDSRYLPQKRNDTGVVPYGILIMTRKAYHKSAMKNGPDKTPGLGAGRWRPVCEKFSREYESEP